MRASPPSLISSVESRRTSVDFPDPFWPRIATHSPRAIVNVTPWIAGQRLRAKRPAFRFRRTKSLRRSRTSTAGVSPRTDVSRDLGAARVDMLLLLVNRKGTENGKELARGGGRT